MLLFERDEVMVGCVDRGASCAFETVCAFATTKIYLGCCHGRLGLGKGYFDITCVMRVFGSVEDAHASIRA